MIGLRAQFLERLREAVDAWEIAPLHGSLFGSAARGDGSSESDIDLLIVRPDAVTATDEVWEAQVDAVRSLVRSWTGNRCQAFDIDRARLGEHVAVRDPLIENWLRDGVLLVGEPLRSVIDGLAVAVQA